MAVRAPILLTGVLLLLALVLWQPSNAAAKACGSIRASGDTWIVGGDGAKCKFQRRWSKRYLEKGDAPRGWDCRGNDVHGGGCDETRGAGFFIFYPPD